MAEYRRHIRLLALLLLLMGSVGADVGYRHLVGRSWDASSRQELGETPHRVLYVVDESEKHRVLRLEEIKNPRGDFLLVVVSNGPDEGPRPSNSATAGEAESDSSTGSGILWILIPLQIVALVLFGLVFKRAKESRSKGP